MTETKLASLGLHGYKTFAKETDLVFPARITAIVGPNGSGKSNVADSIRWVLVSNPIRCCAPREQKT